MRVDIAVIQFAITPFMPTVNLARAEQFIQKAASAGAHIVVFPEDFISGPLSGDTTYADHDGYYIKHFQSLAVKYAIDIVPGSFIEGENDRFYNTSCYIDSEGCVLGTYRKVNLWHPERTYLTAGDSFPVFETRYGRVGLLICWDLIFPEAFRTMVQQQVEIIICPSYWCFEDAGIGLRHDENAEIKLVDALCTARAFENELILVYANAANREPAPTGDQERLIGHSQITVPFKGALHILNHQDEALFIQQVETDLLKDAAQAYTIRKDLLARRYPLSE